MLQMLIYIHGFLSSPLSEKAVETGSYLREQQLAVDYQVPSLSNYPQQAYEQLQQLLEDSRTQYSNIALIGSSLGGFYATLLAEHYGLKAVLVNPVVAPHRLMVDYLGEQQNPYTGERFCLGQADVEQLQLLQPKTLSQPDHYWLLAQQGDETLDYREAVKFYRHSRQLIEPGGNHRFVNFKKHLPNLMKFLELGPVNTN